MIEGSHWIYLVVLGFLWNQFPCTIFCGFKPITFIDLNLNQHEVVTCYVNQWYWFPTSLTNILWGQKTQSEVCFWQSCIHTGHSVPLRPKLFHSCWSLMFLCPDLFFLNSVCHQPKKHIVRKASNSKYTINSPWDSQVLLIIRLIALIKIAAED